MNNEVKLCKDCKWCDEHMRTFFPASVWRCNNPKLEARVNLVSGVPYIGFCDIERNPSFDAVNKCGIEGKLWEAKQ